MPALRWGSQKYAYLPATSNFWTYVSPSSPIWPSIEMSSTFTPAGTASSSKTTLWGPALLMTLRWRGRGSEAREDARAAWRAAFPSLAALQRTT